MPFLDSKALDTDPEGMAFLKAVIRPDHEREEAALAARRAAFQPSAPVDALAAPAAPAEASQAFVPPQALTPAPAPVPAG